MLEMLTLCLSSWELNKGFSGFSQFLCLSWLLNLDHETASARGCLPATNITTRGCVRLCSPGMLQSRVPSPSAPQSPRLSLRRVPQVLRWRFDGRKSKCLKYGAIRSPASCVCSPSYSASWKYRCTCGNGACMWLLSHWTLEGLCPFP